MDLKSPLSTSGMSLNERDWMNQYDTLKKKIMQRRQAGEPVGNPVIQDLNKQVESLTKSLQQMIAAPMEFEVLIQRQEEIIRLQDEMLGDISKGVDRLHAQALTIGDETKQQTRMLDDLDRNVDKTADALKSEAKHAESVKASTNSCGMYICIVVEVLVVVVLVIIIFLVKT